MTPTHEGIEPEELPWRWGMPCCLMVAGQFFGKLNASSD